MTRDLKLEKDTRFEAEALRWLPEVTRFALSLARNDADAADLVQETFLRAYGAWDTYSPGTECRGWLFTICRNAFLRTRQRAERFVDALDPELESLAAAALHASAAQGGYGALFRDFDLGDAIENAISELPDAYREVVVLVDVNDQTYEEASLILAVPIGTVRSRLFRGRRILQESLTAHARDAGLVPSSAPKGAIQRGTSA
ncbi:MAG: sigma-70 family RNA polymerase sigma factor [Gemmatimonadaceae bacterium]